MFILFPILFVLAALVNNELTHALDQAGRDAVVYWHNYYRAELAAGRVKNNTGSFMPKPSLMKQMNYSLECEQRAQSWADQCTYSHSDTAQTFGENFYAYVALDNATRAIEHVVSGWWAELIYRGALGPEPGSTCIPYTGAQNARGIGHWTQLAWWNTNQVGCGIGRCPLYKTYVVCQYRPAGNVITRCVYNVGEPCSGCPKNCNQTSKLCLN
uniref:SCP domain-containing protein n=1 Tax=Meloidogyne enterolobii TaxID=390850 RepID=A0A6V7WJ75_MELEN|nr:unnamed protein product [Meloidogyne enterolobii]